MTDTPLFTTHQFNAFFSKISARYLKILHFNMQSAVNKSDHLSCFLDSLTCAVEVIILSETWYRCDADVIRIPGFASFFLNRPVKRGGGVAILIKESYSCDVLTGHCLSNPDIEMLTIRSGRHTFSAVYRPPDGNLATFLESFERETFFLNSERFVSYIAGDFNVDMGAHSPAKQKMTVAFECAGFRNVIWSPTRITNTCSSVLDLIVTNDDKSYFSGRIAAHISDHLPIFLCIEKHSLVESIIKNRRQPIYERTLELFKHRIEMVDWDPVYNETSAETAYSTFLALFLSIYHECFPIVDAKPSKNARKPWITPRLSRLIKKKHKLFAAFIKTKSPELLVRFKTLRNSLNGELRLAKAAYYNNLFSHILSKNPKEKWKRLNVILNTNKHSEAVTRLTIGGNELEGSQLATAFNQFFSEVAVGNYSDEYFHFMGDKLAESLFLEPTDETEVFKIFRSIRDTNSLDACNIQSRPVKYVLHIIAPCLTYIYNTALSTGHFPTDMQLARVAVIYKKGDKNILGNYRPISVLPFFSKGLERIIHQRLHIFFVKHSVITECQYGFTKNRSTEHALLDQKEYILNNFEAQKLTIGIFVDFSKAFDSLNHNLLFAKLEHYGVRGHALSLIRSYLGSRKQYVQINHCSSDALTITHGVPQGSILGPLLFNVFINDICNVSQEAKYIMYADDCSIFLSSPNLNQLTHAANCVLQTLEQWSSFNALKINQEKTKAIIFHPKGKRLLVPPPIFLAGGIIEYVDSIKILGITFTATMSWDAHVADISTRLSRIVGITSRQKCLLPTRTKLILYYAFFQSCLNYCFLVWGNTTLSNIQKLLALQKKMLRLVINAPYDSPSRPIYAELRIIPVNKFFYYRVACFYKKLIGINDPFLSRLVTVTSHQTPYLMRRANNFVLPRCRTNYGFCMLRYIIPKFLNTMPFVNINIMSFRAIRASFV